jgi:hypothetical protein
MPDMEIRILDLDGSVAQQEQLCGRYHPRILALDPWGPHIRLACGFGRFRRFEKELDTLFSQECEAAPTVTFYGSGDFHHVSLALIRRLPNPINLLVLDNHPDWMRGIPFLHCGTWLYHAARLPQVQHIFHVGGDVDFDNYYRPLAPWRLLRSGKITVFPALRRFTRGAWAGVPNQPIRTEPHQEAASERIDDLLRPYQAELAARPLYISLDKDVMVATEAAVNWDSGHLMLTEVQIILTAFLESARGKVAGMDIIGDWSPVKVSGMLRHWMDLTMHPRLSVDADLARRRNQQMNLRLLEGLSAAVCPALSISA